MKQNQNRAGAKNNRPAQSKQARKTTRLTPAASAKGKAKAKSAARALEMSRLRQFSEREEDLIWPDDGSFNLREFSRAVYRCLSAKRRQWLDNACESWSGEQTLRMIAYDTLKREENIPLSAIRDIELAARNREKVVVE